MRSSLRSRALIVARPHWTMHAPRLHVERSGRFIVAADLTLANGSRLCWRAGFGQWTAPPNAGARFDHS
jgi:hypothetical protein